MLFIKLLRPRQNMIFLCVSVCVCVSVCLRSPKVLQIVLFVAHCRDGQQNIS